MIFDARAAAGFGELFFEAAQKSQPAIEALLAHVAWQSDVAGHLVRVADDEGRHLHSQEPGTNPRALAADTDEVREIEITRPQL